MRFMKDEEAVSPVIGVILMVAITVILAAVIAVFVFGLAGDLESGAQKDVQVTTGTNADGEVEFTIFSGSDVNKLQYLLAQQGTTSVSLKNTSVITVGSKINSNLSKASGEIVLTGAFNDGTKQVLGKSS